MADVNSSDPTLNETTDKAGNDDTGLNTPNSGDNFAVESTGKYGDAPGAGGDQEPESTSQRRRPNEPTPI